MFTFKVPDWEFDGCVLSLFAILSLSVQAWISTLIVHAVHVKPNLKLIDLLIKLGHTFAIIYELVVWR